MNPGVPSQDIVVTGLYGAGNLGDDLLMQVFATAIAEAGLAPVIGAYGPEIAQRATGRRAVPCPRLSPRLPILLFEYAREVRRSRAVVFGGGGLFQDTHSAFTVAEYSAAGAFATVLGRPLLVWGVGLGPFRFAFNEALVRWTLGLAQEVSVRDRESQRLAGRGDAVAVVEDPVWWLAHGGLADAVSPAAGPIAFVFREWPGLSAAAAAEAVSRMCIPLGASAAIIPFEYSSALTRDWSFSDEIANRCRALGVDAVVPLSPQYPDATEVRAALRACRALVTMRFHGAILAITEGVPVVAFDCVPKLVHLFREAGLPERILKLSEIQSDAAARSLTALLANRDAAFAAQRAPFASSRTRVADFQEAMRGAETPGWPIRLKGILVLSACLALLGAGTMFAAVRKIRRVLRRRWARAPRGTVA